MVLSAKQAHASVLVEPKTYKQAIKCQDKEKWILAMEEELRAIRDNNTWTLVDPPSNRNIGCRWVYKIKSGDTTESTRYKARLDAQGYTQKFGEDYDEVFAPVTRSSTFRILLTIASARKYMLKQNFSQSKFDECFKNFNLKIQKDQNIL